MKYLSSLAIVILVMLITLPGMAQQAKTKSPSAQKKVVKINPVNPDATDPNKKALDKFSRDKMYNATPAPKPISPEEVRAMNFYMEGNNKGKAGKFNEAVQEFTKSLDISKSANTFTRRGMAYLMLNNYGAAIGDATDAIRMDQTQLNAYFVRGISRFETGDINGAKQDFDIYLDRERLNPIAFNYMAAVLFMKQDYKGALDNYNEVVRLDPKYPDIYTNRGMMRHYAQDFKGAIQDYNEAIKANPDNATAYNNRGAAKMMLKDLDAALKDFDKAISLDAKYADAYDNRGRVKHALGDTEGACADWQQAYANGLDATRDLIVKFCK